MTAIRREKQLKGWRREKKIVLIEKMNPALAGLGRELGPRNALPGTIPQENALNQHGSGHIFGILRLALGPLRQLRILRAGAQDDKIETVSPS
jgi:hypothetical protein